MMGNLVENFRLPDAEGKIFDLFENLDKKVLLVFYPKDNSPVCTKQLKNYSGNKGKFQSNNIKVVGINPAGGEEHLSFCENSGIDFPLLVDKDKAISKKFDAVGIAGTVKRKLVLIDTDKKIIFEKTVFPLFYLNTEQIFEILIENNVIL